MSASTCERLDFYRLGRSGSISALRPNFGHLIGNSTVPKAAIRSHARLFGECGGTTRKRNLQRTTINALVRSGQNREQAYSLNLESIFSDTNAQTSIRTRIIDEFESLEEGELLEASYVPRSGRDKGKMVTHHYIAKSIRRVIWLKDIAEIRNGKAIKTERVGTWWEGFPLNNLTKEGGVRFPNGKKPESLVERIIELATNPGDVVLDTFGGSGTSLRTADASAGRGLRNGVNADP